MNNVVIVVDMLNGFLNEGKLANPGARRIIPNIVDLLERKKEQGWEMIFVCDNHKKDDLEFRMFPEHCVEGTDETDIVEELLYFRNVYVPKTRYSAFFKTDLESILAHRRPEKVVIVGIYADICVLYTAAGLRNLDYKVIVPKDCTMTLTTMDNIIFSHMRDILGVNIVESQKEI
jgi:nicotinamidase-related amidase